MSPDVTARRYGRTPDMSAVAARCGRTFFGEKEGQLAQTKLSYTNIHMHIRKTHFRNHATSRPAIRVRRPSCLVYRKTCTAAAGVGALNIILEGPSPNKHGWCFVKCGFCRGVLMILQSQYLHPDTAGLRL